MSDRDELLKNLYRRAMSVCHPDRAPAHLRSSMEEKTKELNAAYGAGSFVRVRKIALELGIKDVPPIPKSESTTQEPKTEQSQNTKDEDINKSLFDAIQEGHTRTCKRINRGGSECSCCG